MEDEELWYRAVMTRDPRFDGWFFVAVTSTGIYCRPSCSSVTPRRSNVVFYPSAAAAQKAGFRACKRCRPDASPASPEWDRRSDVVARAMVAIADGLVDREGVRGLARHLGYSERHLGRLMSAELGAGPLDIARAQRAQTARLLLEMTNLKMPEVAFAAGFSSVRQFNDTVRAIFAETPSALRRRANRRSKEISSGSPISLRLAFREPLDAVELFSFLAARAVPGLEEGSVAGYKRALSLPRGAGFVALAPPTPGERWLRAKVSLEDLRDLTAAVKRLRQLFDLDSDPDAVGEVLSSDPQLRPLVARRPGLRVPGATDGAEMCVRALLGQQVSVAAARRLAGRLVSLHGERLPAGLLAGGKTTVSARFPSPERLGSLDPASLAMPASRARALVSLGRALTAGGVSLEPGVERGEVARELRGLPGIGPWTVSYVAMRALSDPDAFLPNDLGVRRGLEALGLPGDPASALLAADRWRPYRSYAVVHLWSAAGDRRVAPGKQEVA